MANGNLFALAHIMSRYHMCERWLPFISSRVNLHTCRLMYHKTIVVLIQYIKFSPIRLKSKITRREEPYPNTVSCQLDSVLLFQSGEQLCGHT
ncbi:hypothetical protein D3C85_1464980 [compost metagenome]